MAVPVGSALPAAKAADHRAGDGPVQNDSADLSARRDPHPAGLSLQYQHCEEGQENAPKYCGLLYPPTHARLPVLLAPHQHQALVKTSDALFKLLEGCNRIAAHHTLHDSAAAATPQKERWKRRRKEVSADHHPQVLSSSDHARASFLYQYHGIQVLKIQWLHEPSSKPPTLYLASCTISLPLIGLVQIAHYITLGSAQGLSPNQLSSQLSAGVSGHSQGIVVAALIAVQLPSKKDTWSEFSQSGLHAITTLFHIGFHGSVAFPQTSLPPKLVEITAENEGVSTPMLATIYSWSRRMPRCPFLTAQSFCSHVSSSHVGRFGICIAKSKAETGRDQSRILLGCSVFNTETGDDMRTEKKGYLESLADEIFTRPIKWTQACVFPEDTTHIINFGLDA
ncbi:hypothetical protein PCASD_14215 [Puccinia coronata f. sp. avenae]|uniref:Starter acyltransferase (SAT) domain-containing protein n=1 Tax=Puccinia coronata f. sp. avenae TaxID=200324 RepID=A0A2N5TNY8_9BASI|nr:hypothetical protein PCASD_14215 [Puccinia coronata f. sp. avenae]